MSTEQGGGPSHGSFGGLQFDKVEHAAPAAPPVCVACRRTLDEYYEVGGQMICATCAGAVRGAQEGMAFLRAWLFGVGAAAAGTVGWIMLAQATNGPWAIVGIAVGLFVGWAVRKGSLGRGGWEYQTLAMVLTYMSIAAGSIPISMLKADAAGALFTAFGDALMAPFMGGTSIIGWIIIAIALYEAWKLNKRVPMSGPFRLRDRRVATEPLQPPGPPDAAPPASGAA